MEVAATDTALLVIDMQNDFVEPDMSSPMLVAGGKAIVPAVIEAVSTARNLGFLIVWVVREHDPMGRDVELFRRHLYADGNGPTTKGTKGAELVHGLAVRDGDYKLVKTRFSAFFATHLHSLLQTNGIKKLVVVGVQTPNCIRQTVFDAVALDYQSVAVIVDATAAATPEVHAGAAALILELTTGELLNIALPFVIAENIRDMKNIGVTTPTLQEWYSSLA